MELSNLDLVLNSATRGSLRLDSQIVMEHNKPSVAITTTGAEETVCSKTHPVLSSFLRASGSAPPGKARDIEGSAFAGKETQIDGLDGCLSMQASVSECAANLTVAPPVTRNKTSSNLTVAPPVTSTKTRANLSATPSYGAIPHRLIQGPKSPLEVLNFKDFDQHPVPSLTTTQLHPLMSNSELSAAESDCFPTPRARKLRKRNNNPKIQEESAKRAKFGVEICVKKPIDEASQERLRKSMPGLHVLSCTEKYSYSGPYDLDAR